MKISKLQGVFCYIRTTTVTAKYGQLCTIVLIAFGISTCFAQTDVDDGTLYKLQVVEDVWLERSTRNYNSYQWLTIGTHLDYPKKRSLLRFEDIPIVAVQQSTMQWCISTTIIHTRPCSWHSVTQAPFITRTIQAHRVLKSWQETQATTTYKKKF